MKSSRILLLTAALGAFALAGCTTPETRIQGNPEVFARLTPEQQALVKAGQIAVGFDMETVKLALGDPNRVTLHTTAAGQTQVWHYVTYDYGEGPFMYGGPFGGYYGGFRRGRGFYGPGWGGGWGMGDPFGFGYPVAGHDRLRVTFDNNARVVSIQEERP